MDTELEQKMKERRTRKVSDGEESPLSLSQYRKNPRIRSCPLYWGVVEPSL